VITPGDLASTPRRFRPGVDVVVRDEAGDAALPLPVKANSHVPLDVEIADVAGSVTVLGDDPQHGVRPVQLLTKCSQNVATGAVTGWHGSARRNEKSSSGGHLTAFDSSCHHHYLRLKPLWPQGRAGSTPAPGTRFDPSGPAGAKPLACHRDRAAA
jgi:hypothetical protein